MRDDVTMPFKVSYAQNREDILLEGMLKNIEEGFYVDVGANHATLDSVTKLFYDKGWRGINVEPSPDLFEGIIAARPRDINLNIGMGAKKERRKFRYYKNGDGLSTFSPGMMEEYSKNHDVHTDTYEDSEVQIETLSEVLKEHAPKNIHFMKIDVEGFEYEVLRGNDWKKFRPWVICIEATHIQHEWDKYLQKQDYVLLLFDGLNNYYVANEHSEIIESFSYAKTIFPTPILTRQAAMFVKELQKSNGNLATRIANFDVERAHLVSEVTRLHHEIARTSGIKGSVKSVARAVDRAAAVYIAKLNKPKVVKTKQLDITKNASLDETLRRVRLYDFMSLYGNGSGERMLYRAANGIYRQATRTPLKGMKRARRAIQARRLK